MKKRRSYDMARINRPRSFFLYHTVSGVLVKSIIPLAPRWEVHMAKAVYIVKGDRAYREILNDRGKTKLQRIKMQELTLLLLKHRLIDFVPV
jgi:hypothetical protein